MNLKAKHAEYGEVTVVGFLGTDYNKAFLCVVVTPQGEIKAVQNFTLNAKIAPVKEEMTTDLELKERLDDMQAEKDTRKKKKVASNQA